MTDTTPKPGQLIDAGHVQLIFDRKGQELQIRFTTEQFGEIGIMLSHECAEEMASLLPDAERQMAAMRASPRRDDETKH